MKILLKYWKTESSQPKILHSTNPRRMAQELASPNFYKAYLKVSYPSLTKVYGGLPFNEGEYFNKEELQKAFRAFIEEGRIWT